MRSRKLALLFVPVMLLAALPGVATASGPSAQAESRAEVLKYWTPAKMKSAKWLDVHYDKTEKVGHLVTRSQFLPTGTNNGSWNGTTDNSNDEIAHAEIEEPPEEQKKP